MDKDLGDGDKDTLPDKFPVTVESVKIAATTDTDTEGELSQDTRELSVKEEKTVNYERV